MASLLQVVDNGTILFDFNTSTGTGNPNGILTTLLGDPDYGGKSQRRQVFASEKRGGAMVTHVVHDIEPMRWRVRMRPPDGTTATLLAGYSAMVEILAAGGRIKRIDDGTTEVRYCDFLVPERILGLMRGQDTALLDILTHKDDWSGLPIVVEREGPWFLDEVDPTVQRLANSLLFSDASDDGVPNGWTVVGSPSSPNINETDQTFQFTVNGIDQGYRQDLAASAGQVWSARVDAAMLAGNRPARLHLSFRDATTELAAVSANTSSTSYTGLSVTSAAAPAGTTTVRIALISHTTGSGAGDLGFRKPQLEQLASVSAYRVGPETVSNDPTAEGGRVFFFDVDTDDPVYAKLKLEFLTGFQTDIRIAALTPNHPAEPIRWGNVHKASQFEDDTLGTGAAVVADANASGGDAVEITFGTNDLTVFRTKGEITTDLAALRGRFAILGRVRGTVGTDDFSVQMAWGTSGSADHLMPIQRFTDLGTNFRDVFLGTINLRDDVDAAELEIWLYVRRDAGTGNFRADFRSHVPAEQMTVIIGTALSGAAGEYVITDPRGGSIERRNSTGKLLKYLPHEVGVPLVLPGGVSAIWVSSDTGSISNTIKASITYAPMRHA